MLLKNVMDYGEIASELSESERPPLKFSDMQPTPVPALLQGRETPTNIVHSSGRLPVTREDIERMMQQERGKTPLGQGVPPPIPKMPLGIERPKIAPQYANPLTSGQYVTDQTQELRDQKEEEAHLDRLQTDRDYLERFM